MSAVARVCDVASCPCRETPDHMCAGPAKTSSHNVLAEGFGILREGDIGCSECCEIGWRATPAARSVFVNNRRVVSKGDTVINTLGTGKIRSGSNSVIVCSSKGNLAFPREFATIVVMIHLNDHPLEGVEVTTNHGNLARTKADGCATFRNLTPTMYSIIFFGATRRTIAVEQGEHRMLCFAIPLSLTDCRGH
jgi:hypothetical protein